MAWALSNNPSPDVHSIFFIIQSPPEAQKRMPFPSGLSNKSFLLL